ncbi:MAG: ABC transporter substrate-binding protein [Lentisphaeria bacterium]|nr:ABC transporter substrate-binding protein [Lentisphaeria bacterium]
MIVKPENAGKFRNLANFKGARVGLGKLSTGDVIFRGALKKAGVDPYKDLEIIEFGGQGAVVEAVRKGAVDAGIVFSPHFSLAKKNYGLVVSNYIADFQPAYTCCRLIANTKDLKAKREIYKRYLVAEIRAYRFYRENQEETVKIFADSFKLDPGIVRADTYTDHTFDSNPDPLKKGTVDFWNTMNEIGYLPENRVDISRHIDTSIYREALDEVLKRWPDDPVYREMDAFFKANN